MSALDDLKTAMAALINEATTDLETVISRLGQVAPDDTATLQALTQQANDAVAKLKADMAPLTAPASTGTTPADTTTTSDENPPA